MLTYAFCLLHLLICLCLWKEERLIVQLVIGQMVYEFMRYLNFCCRISIKESSVAKLGSVCRRVYRIFSHAYFHHRTIFDEFENETFLCRR